MKAITYNKEKFKSLKQYVLEDHIISTEADFYIVPNSNPLRIMKIFHNLSYKNLNNKVRTICELDKHKKEIGIPELIIPDRMVIVDKNFVGCASPYINGVNADVLLSARGITLENKIRILKQIGSILEKIASHNKKLGLAFGDVHAGNFIYDSQKTYAIDTDSMKINGNDSSTSLYLTLNPNLNKCGDKYEANVYGIYSPTTNSDILGFIMTILEIVSNGEVYKLRLDRYYDYLDYLDKLGFDSKLLDCFASVYDKDRDNINPTPYLDGMKISEETSLISFKNSIKH